MPSPRVLNFDVPREPTNLERTLQSFSQQNVLNQERRQESDALTDLYKQYQGDGANLQAKIESIQKDPRLSPTTRVNTIDQLLKFQKYNGDLQKSIQKQQLNERKEKETNLKIEAEKAEKEAREMETLRALEKAGATPEQIDLYKASPVGGQTKIVEDILEGKSRKNAPQGLISPDIEDYDQGLTPSERVKRQDQRYSVQTPLINKNNDSLAALETESLSLNLLNELTDSGQVGQGLKSVNINPKTGDLFLPAAASPEEQLFVKTVNDFTVKAKDSFGARVTNFELDRFMQRLPTLANSTEGRKLILRQMSIVNQINQLEKRAIQKVFDQYGVRNIDYADAENKARSSISGEKESLRKEYLDLEQVAKKEDAELVKNIKEKVKPGYTALRTPDGKIKQFPNENIEQLLEKNNKYKRI